MLKTCALSTLVTETGTASRLIHTLHGARIRGMLRKTLFRVAYLAVRNMMACVNFSDTL